ncbi:phage tail tape measure protein [Kitasatospora sp. NPDC092286]|uniref:phage tail tape measure protein n=1 Tax=Kitasatospora sp. NPDC092286 TaxID=3364087 RepID=UPI00381E2A22
MAVEVGMGYLSIVPEVEGFARELQQQVTGPSEAAGQQAGQRGGQAAGEGFTSKMGGFLKGSLLTIGLAAAAVLAKGFSDALEQTKIDGKIQASLGTTPETAARYGKAAGQLYAQGVTDNVEEAAQALSGVMRAGILPPDATNKQIESITGRVTDLSKTFELDLGQTSNAVGQMLKNGLAKDGTEALDILTKGMQQMGPRADDMADTMNEYSTKFRDLGLSAADAMGLMSQGMAAGARDTDVVADALKEFQIRATDGSKASTEAYEAIGLNAEAMTKKVAEGGPAAREGLQQVLDGLKAVKDPADRSAAAVGLFGTKAEDLGKALWALDPKTAVAALGDTAGAAEEMGTALHDNAGSRVEQFKRGLEVGLTNFMGDHVIPLFERAGSVVSQAFGPALDYGRRLAADFFGVFSGPGPTAVGTFGQTVVGLGSNLRNDLMPGVQGIVSLAQTTLLPAFQSLGQVVSGELLPALMTVYSAVASAVVPILSGLGQILLGTVWPAAMRVYTAIAENLQPIFSAVSDFMRDRVAPAAELIGGKFLNLVEKAQPVISVVSSVLSWFGRLAADILGTTIPVIVRLAGPVFSNFVSGIGLAIDWIAKGVGFVGKLAMAFRDAGKPVADFSAAAVEKLGEFIGWLGGLGVRAMNAVGNFRTLLVEKGKDLARGILDGIQSMGSWLADKLSSWAKSVIPGPIADALGIKSPSRVLADRVGRWIPPGIVQGIDQAEPDLMARLRALVTIPPVRVPAPVVAPAAGAGSGVPPQITVNARTDASAYEIGRQVAWQMRMGVA